MTDTAAGASSSKLEDAAAAVFPGASETAARCRACDWASSPLGPVAGWPPSLRTVAGLVVGAGFPMILLWGPELVQLYNDGYVPFLAARHPGGLGRPTREVWPEVWHLNQPVYVRVFAGETVALEAAYLPVRRRGPDGPAEDLYVTLAYSPVPDPAPDDSGRVGGVLVMLRDVTAEVAGRAAESELSAGPPVRRTQQGSAVSAPRREATRLQTGGARIDALVGQFAAADAARSLGERGSDFGNAAALQHHFGCRRGSRAASTARFGRADPLRAPRCGSVEGLGSAFTRSK